MIRLVFLGRLADLAGAGELMFAAEAPLTLDAILTGLDPPLAAALRQDRVKCAVNGSIVPQHRLNVVPGDELAFLPPVSGG